MLFSFSKAMLACREIIEEIKRTRAGRGEVERIKARVARRRSLKKIPSNAELLSSASDGERELLLPLLRKKPVRSLSGIAVVAVASKPASCPGECIYCPRGEDSPQSYTGHEPAMLRARASGYDPHLQVRQRLEQLKRIGHSVDKVELIVMGGTFPSLSWSYQEEFVTRCLDAMSSFSGGGGVSPSIWEAQQRNEASSTRCVGMTFETRPDFSRLEHVNRMLRLGATRVELGVQTLSEEVYRRVKRGHTLRDVEEATRMLKDAGLKAGYHMMPGLFSTMEEDREMFRELFTNPSYMPDTIKIYPTLVVRGTELYELWKSGEFSPYSSEEAAGLIAELKCHLPRWVRTMRIQRDIPAKYIEAGVTRGDLGALVAKKLEEGGERCRCIRCRDIGHLGYKHGAKSLPENQELLVESYPASEGEEIFVSYEDSREDALLAYLRLRFPSARAERSELESSAVVRELRVLGPALPLGTRSRVAEQHRGYGRKLLSHAERLAREEGFERLLVLSAIGTRQYYSRLGYSREGPYMQKEL